MHPAGRTSWGEPSAVSLHSAVPNPILWFLNQFLGYKRKGRSNNGASQNKSGCRSGKPPIALTGRKLSRRHLSPLHFCIASMENEIAPILAWKGCSSYFTPGPASCHGQLVEVQPLWLVASQGGDGGCKMGLQLVPNKAILEILFLI